MTSMWYDIDTIRYDTIWYWYECNNLIFTSYINSAVAYYRSLIGLVDYLAYAELVKPFDCIFISSVKHLDPTGKLRERAFVDNMWHCLLPHARNGSSHMPQSYGVAAQRPWPVWYRLRIVQSLLLRSKPGWLMVGSIIRNWLGTSWLKT